MKRPSYLTVVPDAGTAFKPPRRTMRRRPSNQAVPTFVELVALLSQAADCQILAQRLEKAAEEKDHLVVRALAPRVAVEAKYLCHCIGRALEQYPNCTS